MKETFYFSNVHQYNSSATRATTGLSLREKLKAVRKVEPVEIPMVEKTEPDSRIIKRIMESKVFGGRVEVVFNLDEPETVAVRNVAYGHDEIRDLISRSLPADELLEAHKIKELFDGAVLTDDEASKIQSYPISEWR